MHVKILQTKNNVDEKVWPANLALFIYGSTLYVENINNLTSTDTSSRLDGLEAMQY